MLLIYLTTHFVMLFFALFDSNLIFMLPAPLATCSHVLISEQDPDVSNDDIISDDGQNNTIGSSISSSWKFLNCFGFAFAWWRAYKSSFKRRLRWKLEEVKVVDCESGLVRWFYHTSIWYKWSKSKGFFVVRRFEIPTPHNMHLQFQIGGLDADDAERARLTYGRNLVDMKVDSVFFCLVNEFRSPIYVYQFAVFWLFFWYGTWNVAVFFILMTLMSGSFRAVFVVRRNQLKIQKLAALQAEVSVLRRPGKVKDRPVFPGSDFEKLENVRRATSTFIRTDNRQQSAHLNTNIPSAVSISNTFDDGVESTKPKQAEWLRYDSEFIFPGDLILLEKGICPCDCVLVMSTLVATTYIRSI
eukprot:gene426-123_t